MQRLKLSTKDNALPYDVLFVIEDFGTGCCCGNDVVDRMCYGVEEGDAGPLVKQSARFVAVVYNQAQHHDTMKQKNASSKTAT